MEFPSVQTHLLKIPHIVAVILGVSVSSSILIDAQVKIRDTVMVTPRSPRMTMSGQTLTTTLSYSGTLRQPDQFGGGNLFYSSHTSCSYPQSIIDANSGSAS